MTIEQLIKSNKESIDYLDLEILIANSLGQTREFILTHPEYTLTNEQRSKINKLIKRRLNNEPIAYILGHKEFYGLDFVVNKHTLIPRPETELMVELAINESRIMNHESCTIVDVGTGSGCIIISLAHTLDTKYKIQNTRYFATDISKEALKIAKKNAKVHDLDKKITFLNGSLITPFIQDTRYKIQNTNLVIAANLPYLSKEIYASAADNVKKFEPKSALYSAKQGLDHYERLLKQIKKLLVTGHWSLVTVFLEISPEQKQPVIKLIKSILPKAKIVFQKDLAGKWRVCKVIAG